jgi:hypothetical protein
MLYGAIVAVCSEINTKHTHRAWLNVKFLNVNLLVHHVSSILAKVNIRKRTPNFNNFSNATKCGISGGKSCIGTGFSRSTGISGLEA